MPGAPVGVTNFASTLQGVASVISSPSKRTPKNPAFRSGTPKPVLVAPKLGPVPPKPGPVAPKPDQAIAATVPFTKLEPPVSETDPMAPPQEADPEVEPAASRTETDRDMKVAVAKTEPMIPMLKPPSTPGGIPMRASVPQLAPSTMPAVYDPDATLLGPPGRERVAPAARPKPIAPYVPGQNLREAYPALHQLPPSPMRPPLFPPGDRPASAGTIARFDMARTMRRDAIVRNIALVISLAIAALVAFLVASRL